MTRMLRFAQGGGRNPRATDAPEKFVLYHALLDAFGKPGCPICVNLEPGSLKALNDMLYEQVTDPASCRRLIESGGFCNWHAWMLPRVQHSPLGVALIYGHLLQEVLDRLNASRRHIRFATEVVGQEGSSRRRVLDVFAGCPGVIGALRCGEPAETRRPT